jgi:hypothetical protein
MGKGKTKAGLENATQQPARRSAGIAQTLPLGGVEVEQDKGPVTARGVPLTELEWAQLETFAAEHGGATVTSLLSVLVRYGMRDAQAGKVKLKLKNRRNRPPQFIDFSN